MATRRLAHGASKLRTQIRAVVRYTRNFEVNLERIEAFWRDSDFPQGYDRLLDEIGERVITNLEQHPRIGRSFWARKTDSIEALRRIEALRGKFGAEADFREYLMTDYLVLYALIPAKAKTRAPPAETIHLLAIKHYKQLAFDLG